VPGYKIGWMIEAMEIDPFSSDRFMYGTGLSLYGSNDLTKWDVTGSTFTLQSMVLGQEETVVLDMAAPPTGPLLFTAVGDDGGFVHTSLTTVPQSICTSPIFTTTLSVDYAELAPAYVVRSGTAPQYHIGFSTNSGGSWFQGSSEPVGGDGGQVAMSADGLTVLWAPKNTSSTAVSYSTTFGSSWTACTGIPAESFIASDRVNPLKFYALASGTFYSSVDGGHTFTTASTGYSAAQTNYRPIKAVPGAEGHVWMATTGGLLKSTNGGVTFASVSSTVTAALAVGFGIKSATGTYVAAVYLSGTVGGVQGVFRSDDGGSTWVRINDNAHQYGGVGVIEGDKRVYGRVFLGGMGGAFGAVYGSL